MAEWLCSGLQSRLRRFDSGFSLNFMKNILILLPSLGQGGAEKIHIDLANSWSDIYKVTLVTLFNDQALRDNLNERINF